MEVRDSFGLPSFGALRDVPLSDRRVLGNVVQEESSEPSGVESRVVDDAGVPNSVELGLLSEPRAVDRVSSTVARPSNVKRLVNISGEVDEEGDGRGLRSGSVVRPLNRRKFLGLDGEVLDRSNHATLVRAIC